jgi:hypothetical protein
MGKLRRRHRTYKNRPRSAKHHKKIINMKGCSNGQCAGQKGGCGCGLCGGSKQTGGAWSTWNPTSGGEFFPKNSYNVQPDRMIEATRTTLGSTPFSAAVGGGGRSKRKGRKHRTSKRRTIRIKKGGNRCISQQNGGGGSPGSIIQEFINAKSEISDMIGNAYTSYKGIDPMPSSAVYRDQFLKVV